MAGQQHDEEQPTLSEIADDYDIALAEGVDDETLLEEPNGDVFAITSYGADYPVDTLISRLKSESFFVPTFQRQFVWSQRHASRFVESLLMGLPIPGIFLYKEPSTNKHLVVDGQQRLRTLQYFYSGLFEEKKFRLKGVRSDWNDKTYEELSESDKRKLDDTIVHATIFQQDEPKDTNRSLYFVFERINSGGIRLSPQEIRNCINNGPLLDVVRACNDDSNWRNCFGKKNNRQKDQELIIRFFAMHEKAREYKRPMKDFLNEFSSEYNKQKKDKFDNLEKTFKAAIKLCWEAKAKSVFRPSGALNAAVFESVLLGVAKRIDGGGVALTKEALAVAYDKLLEDTSYLRSCERATADEESVINRHKLAIAAFLGA
ncbi:DUF262 domain-containing protein [Sinorhizobium meliloti]|uniref:DUF262 domain-containing protein n=1 Tax=Rhizobium meliloti TaxID=382 RepID=UPI000FD9F598|nr:DUF262 domain-containing protein [Sinorhizobium meliloti]RVG33202.1 DUF262 domain-containing protein [Sinorhizobium meliloti]